jgi:hypothetical protein
MAPLGGSALARLTREQIVMTEVLLREASLPGTVRTTWPTACPAGSR